MLRRIAALAANLEIDRLSNRVAERFYRNRRDSSARFQRPFQILVYHKVSQDPHPFFEPVTPAAFREQMAFLRRYYNVMDLGELVDRSAIGDVPPMAVAITFDDGYRDNYEYAFPILREYGLPATIFVSTGVIGNKDVLWHDRVFDSFRFTTRESARVPAVESELILNTPEMRKRGLETVLRKAKTLWGVARQQFVERVEDALQPDLDHQDRNRMLDWDQIREMHAGGLAFGSHTVSHPILSLLPMEELAKELRQSKDQLTDHLGTPINTFAYPNGKAADYNEDVKTVLRQNGYKCAVTTAVGPNRVFADPFELRRDLPWEKDIDLFRLRFFLQRHDLC